MGLRIFWLVLLRTVLVLASVGTLGCHIVQVVLLKNPEWWPKNYAYILYFVGPGVSTLSSLALLVTMIFKIKSIRGDRILGCLNLALMIATVVIGTIKSGPVPWLPNDAMDPTVGGYQSKCSVYQKAQREIYNRCWLSNGMWMGVIVVAFFWLVLVLYVFIQRASDIYDDDEYEVYDFKGGMAITSHSPILTPLKQQTTPPVPAHQPIDHGYYDMNYIDYGQQQQQQYANYQSYDAYDPQHYPTASASGHRYYVPALTPGAIPSPRTPTTETHSEDTTHMMTDLGGAGVDPHKKQVPNTYD